jgi:hypothetical protein
MCHWQKWCKSRITMLSTRPLGCQLLRQLQLEIYMSHRICEKSKIQIRMDNPHVAHSCIQQKKKTVPPLVQSAEAGINTSNLVSSVNTNHILSVLQKHRPSWDFFPRPSKFPPYILPWPLSCNWLCMCGKQNRKLFVFPHGTSYFPLIMHSIICPPDRLLLYVGLCKNILWHILPIAPQCSSGHGASFQKV